MVVAKIVRPMSSILTTDEFKRMIEDQPVLGMVAHAH
jgi:hypothetical protein